jgi:hypothetical protein
MKTKDYKFRCITPLSLKENFRRLLRLLLHIAVHVLLQKQRAGPHKFDAALDPAPAPGRQNDAAPALTAF